MRPEAGDPYRLKITFRRGLFRKPRRKQDQQVGVGQTVAAGRKARGGKSGLHRAERWVTPRRGDPRTAPQKANRPALCGVRVKRWGKSPPDAAVTRHARHTPFGARPNREGGRPDHCLPGRLLEGTGNRAPRGMTVWCGQPHDRTRLIVRLPLVNKVCDDRKLRHIICCGKTLGAHTRCRARHSYG